MYNPTYSEVVNTTSTPAYVFDTDVIKSRIEYIRAILGNDIQLCYAMKANPFVIDGISNTIDRFEVCSPGEFKICERAGIDISKVVLSGVYKEANETVRVLETYKDSIVYTCESLNQFHLINDTATKNGFVVNVLLRVTTGNQFGIDQEELCLIVKDRELYKGVHILGIQHFSGTQRKRISRYKEELAFADNLLTRLKQDYNFDAEELEFGPGFYVEYFQDGKPYDEVTLLKEFRQELDALQFKGHITLELGRFIAASCGKYYTSIVDIKKNEGTHFCIVDGGMHQIVYFGQMMAMKLPFYRQLRKDEQLNEEVNCNICGSLCTINDNLVKSLPLKSPQLGDILEFHNVGAYAMCEGIGLFLSRDLPKVYLYSESKGFELMREKFETNVLNYK